MVIYCVEINTLYLDTNYGIMQIVQIVSVIVDEWIQRIIEVCVFYIFFFFFIRNFNLNIHVPYIFSFHITKLIFFFCSEKQTHTYTKIGDTFFDLTNFTLMVNVNISESKKKTTTKIHVHDRDYHCHCDDFDFFEKR